MVLLKFQLMGWLHVYPFNGNATDESGNGNNGTVYGATLTTDRFGNANKAYNFNGVNNYIEMPNSPSLNITDQIIISCWIQYDFVSDCYEDVFMKGNTSYGFQFSCDENHTLLFHLTSNGWRNLNSNVHPEPYIWYHYAGTYEYSSIYAIVHALRYDLQTILETAGEKESGYSVRCIKDY